LKPFGVGDRAVVIALAAFLVAGEVERLEDFLTELGALAQHGLDHVRRRISKAREVIVALVAGSTSLSRNSVSSTGAL
jgi:hypothetical protein